MIQATQAARVAIQEIAGRSPENIAGCDRTGDGWRVLVEIVELKARITDNDLVATYEILLDLDGQVTRYTRLARYRRGDAARAA